ncbi:MAG TPA: PaaI family thioesterase [Acidimicrobiia bacterium]|nr:PaaI family thioesterase [Acidimicrobiia bacterium]
MHEPQGDMPIRLFVTEERVRLAQAIRHLIDTALTAEDASAEDLAAAADKTERLASDLHGRRDLGDRPSGIRQRAEMSHDDYLPRSPLVGEVSPLAPPIEYEYRDGRLIGRGTFHAAYEGPPGYVHGGWIALGFDEMLGMANIASGHPGMTGRLSVRYRRPTPLHRPVAFDAWTEEVDGRRIVTRGTLTVDGVVTAEAEGLFVIIDLEKALEYFGERAYERRQVADPLP